MKIQKKKHGAIPRGYLNQMMFFTSPRVAHLDPHESTSNAVNDKASTHTQNEPFIIEQIVHGLLLFTTEVNHTRLYWLWTKYCILAGVNKQWILLDNALPALEQLGPVTDGLSYGLYALQIVLLCIFILKKTEKLSVQYHSANPSPYPLSQDEAKQVKWKMTKDILFEQFKAQQWQLMSCLLWGISNFLSATYLCSSSIRSNTNSPGWWGMMGMQILLIYDVADYVRQYIAEQKQATADISPVKDVNVDIQLHQLNCIYQKRSIILSLVYSSVLSIGFFMFRGFGTPHLNPTIGAALCVLATMVMNSLEWHLRYSKHQALHQSNHDYKKLVGISISIGIDLLLPLLIWVSLDSDYTLATIVTGLVCMTAINAYLKYQIPHITPLQQYSHFAIKDEQETFTTPSTQASIV